MRLSASNSSVIHGFQIFYYDLLRQKEKVLSLYFSNDVSKDPPSAAETTTDTAEISEKQNEIEGAIVTVQKNLISVVDKATDAMLFRSKLTNKMIEEAKYVMVVLADEIFINLKWEGAKLWRFSLLEKQIFHSEVAGDKFFSMLDEIIENLNSSSDELAFVYLMALSLGFKGKYRGIENSSDRLAWYKEKLYSKLHDKPSRLFYPGRGKLIEECYDYTYTDDNKAFLPDTKFWTWCVIAVISVYIVVSYFVWYNITNDVSDVLHKIYEQTRQGPLI